MHIPDGFLDAGTLAATAVVSAATLGYALKRTGRELEERQIPLMGVVSAFVFAAQMLNFPVVGGTSGHLLGGVIAAVLLGPWAGSLVMATVLIVQCLVFQDGGLLALGANIFNMAVLGTIGGYLVYQALGLLLKHNPLAQAAGAAWFSVVTAAAACSLELAVSGISPLPVVLPAMLGVHALIGIGEASITTVVLSVVWKTRPDLLESRFTFRPVSGKA
ncbi:MAG: energy-coupling factor ABC transporter permease [Bacillota bacterium]